MVEQSRRCRVGLALGLALGGLISHGRPLLIPRRVIREIGGLCAGALGVELGIGQAIDRRGVAHAPRVETDDVIGGDEVLGEHARSDLGKNVDAGASGAARIDEQRAGGRIS